MNEIARIIGSLSQHPTKIQPTQIKNAANNLAAFFVTS